MSYVAPSTDRNAMAVLTQLSTWANLPLLLPHIDQVDSGVQGLLLQMPT
jgi:hypothetical protein